MKNIKKAVSWIRSTKGTVWFMKYIPLIGTILMVIHCAMFLGGVKSTFVEMIVGFPISSMLMFLLLSRQFHFCALHKHLIAYVAAMDIFIYLQKEGLWIHGVKIYTWIMLCIGIALIFWALLKYLIVTDSIRECA